MLTVLHASDFQCGRPFRPAAAEALVRLADETAPDVVVVAGDLTQRAKDREYLAAMSLIGRLPDVPYVVTPGNHDVPLYRVWERLFTPYRNWRRRVAPELDSVTRVPGATFVALNSSAPHRAIVNGRVDDVQVEFAARSFAASASDDVRVLVVHHHFVPVPDGKGGKPLPRAPRLLKDFEEMGVDLVLGGHVHQTHVTTSQDLLGGASRSPLPLIACGTTTSWRGRGPEADLNSLNVVRVRDEDIEVVPHLLGPGGTAFEPGPSIVFERGSRAGGARNATGGGAA